MRSALPALSGQLLADDELVVVDNASSDGTADAVRELAPKATVIEAGSNLGFASGCNLGAEAASNELLVFLNPDAVPAEGFREAIERPMVGGPGVGRLAGARHRRGGTGDQHARAASSISPASPGRGEPGSASTRRRSAGEEPGFASGACLAIPRGAL